MADRQNSNAVKTARTTFEILEELKERNEATVTELTDAFDLSKSSLHNYLTTLEADGYVVKNGNTYEVGLRLLDLGGHARHRQRLYDIAREEVTELAEETGELANLLVEQHGRGVYLHRAHGVDAVKTDSYIGQRVYLHNTGLGNAILAHLPRERIEEILDRHGMPATTENTITDREELFSHLERVREEGVAFDDEARVKGLRCVAVPIVNNNDTVEGAISVSGPTSRFQDERFREELPAKLKSVANVIELNITYT
ncbi:IclR family transcriptional regulator [Halomicroarcula limicola]|uniref:IclR family transcriptional regulator n=1 Tax=Haloarcula limicola TaxID=1429915 RepID=A0A8J7YCB2_9EURY|nr:IclR family transcriptional regulator [Halomicroarcula limicola]MBV0926026.1 IclR family transcriptional regulator [Halomicroarcula limicola]